MSEIEETREHVKKVLISTTCRSLPFELVTQILTWLPVKSLLRFKCVSKEWLSVIKLWPFILEHWYQGSPVKYFGNPETLLQQFCCGLLLEKYRGTKKLRISNPSTHQVLDLPDPCWQECSISIFMLQSSGTFKIVLGKDGGWAVLALGTDDLSWRILKAPGSPELVRVSNYDFTADEVVYYVKRVFHENLLSEIEVESLDLETETLTKTSLPTGFFSELSMVKAICWDDCLALTCKGEKELYVLVLEDYKSGRWSTEKIIVPLKFMEDDTDMDIYWDVMHKEGDLIDILSEDGEIFYYNMVSGKLQIRDAAPKGIGKNPYFMKPSLVYLKGMQTRMEAIVTDP